MADPTENLKRTPAEEPMPQGWDAENLKWMALRVDPSGRLMVSQANVPVGEATKTRTYVEGVMDLADAPALAKRAILFLEDSDVRFWLTGSVPTDTNGFLARRGSVIELESRQEINGFRVKPIVSGETAKFSINYLGENQS